MEQEFEITSRPAPPRNRGNIAIIGAGASGCVCAYYLLKEDFDVTLFDSGAPLRTLLPTGGGRCNLAHAEFDSRELAKNYPRGEKFLYSVFSRFSTSDTLELFEEIGIKTYTQEDGRIFPESNSAKDVRNKILAHIKKAQLVKEKVLKIEKLGNGYKIKSSKAEYLFSNVIVAAGGRFGYELLKELNINIILPKPSLVGLNSNIRNLSGVVVKNAVSNDTGLSGDILFTHFGISGPLIYKISSIKALDSIPYNLSFDLAPELTNLQEILNRNPHKELKNILGEYLPKRLANFIAGNFSELKGHQINGKTRNFILDKMHNFTLNITGTNSGEETVTAGGVDLDEINPKTMESKKYKGLYFIGEILNIDGFCGGFNLQNAWSTAFVAANSISQEV